MPSNEKTFSIVAEPRELTGKRNGRLRRKRLIPGVLYGYNVQPQNVQVAQLDFERTYLRAGSTTLVDLSIGEGGKPRKVFIHDVQRNPINHVPMHIDFMAINLTEEMTVNVQLVLVGESPIVHNREGVLLHHTEHITLRSLPANIPQLIEVDISGLTEVDQAIHVSDLELPENVTLLSSPEEMVVKITEVRVTEEEVEEAEAEAAAEAEAEGDATEGGAGAEAGEEGES
jgi:large subunit ribosomal protein L25